MTNLSREDIDPYFFDPDGERQKYESDREGDIVEDFLNRLDTAIGDKDKASKFKYYGDSVDAVLESICETLERKDATDIAFALLTGDNKMLGDIIAKRAKPYLESYVDGQYE